MTFDTWLFCPPVVNYDIDKFRTERSDLFYLHYQNEENLNSNPTSNSNSKIKEKEDKICVCIIRPKYWLLNLKKYIIFSHGNGSDINSLFEFAKQLADTVHAHVVLYTYPGYGTSTGKPNETGCYKSLDIVVNYFLNIDKNNEILLMGQSLGTAVTIDYVSRHPFWENPIVLISPFRSVSRVIYDNYLTTYLYGKFDNTEKIKLINCPVKFYHGLQDKLVKPSHSESLYLLCNDKSLSPTYLEEACHNNILSHIDWKEINNFF